MDTLISLILVVFAILQIILFFKIWGMTNDIREIRDKYLKSDIKQIVEPQNNLNMNYELNELVVDIKTGKQMRIKEYKDNKYSCYVNSGTKFVGDFDESEIRKFS